MMMRQSMAIEMAKKRGTTYRPTECLGRDGRQFENRFPRNNETRSIKHQPTMLGFLQNLFVFSPFSSVALAVRSAGPSERGRGLPSR